MIDDMACDTALFEAIYQWNRRLSHLVLHPHEEAKNFTTSTETVLFRMAKGTNREATDNAAQTFA
jgi:hypothetical protein